MVISAPPSFPKRGQTCYSQTAQLLYGPAPRSSWTKPLLYDFVDSLFEGMSCHRPIWEWWDLAARYVDLPNKEWSRGKLANPTMLQESRGRRRRVNACGLVDRNQLLTYNISQGLWFGWCCET